MKALGRSHTPAPVGKKTDKDRAEFVAKAEELAKRDQARKQAKE
jgi:hypothetical protein